MLKRPLGLVVLVSLMLSGLGLHHADVAASTEADCAIVGETALEVCDPFLSYWESNGGEETFGDPLTPEVTEIDPQTMQERQVQYFAFARLELHTGLEETDYLVQAGRLGAELIDSESSDPDQEPEVDREDPYYFEQTGYSIGAEFQDHWAGNGLEFGDEGVSFPESLALYGFPISPVEEVEQDGEVVQVQWFERTRMERDQAGDVTAIALGTEANDDADGLSHRVVREIDGSLARILDEHDSSGIGVWLDSPDLGTHEWTPGYANPETETAYTLDTHHRIGSVTKPIVASVILQLVDEGHLALDDTVDEWFPELDGAGNVTVEMLGTMTSGVFNYTETLAWGSAMIQDPERVWEPEELIEFGFDLTGTAEPDGSWTYSNTNYIMLGLIIEDITGNDLVTELESRVFEPLELDNTSFPDPDDATLPEPFARGMSGMLPGTSMVDATDWNPSWGWAAGQVISTPDDMLVFAEEIYHGGLLSDGSRAAQHDLVDVISEEMLEELPAAEIDRAGEVGYGFGVLFDNGWYGHDGIISGYTTMVTYRPDLETSLVVMSNADSFGSEGAVATGSAYYEIQRILEREYPLPSES
jgi:D-alanyl-D-alanine carboxypeptidase